MKIKKENSIIKISGNKAGKTVAIMSGVHGNEQAGVEASLRILKNIKVTQGTVYFIFANLRALEQNIRYTQQDMNRSFGAIMSDSYEVKRAKEIMEVLSDCEYLLDIHNTISTENSVPFLISEYPEFASVFDVEYCVSGFDALHPGGSDGWMNSIGKKGICMEVGNIYDKKSERRAEKAIINFLQYMGNIAGDYKVFSDKKSLHFGFIYTTKTNKFRLSKPFKDFEKIKKGHVIAQDGGKRIIAPYDGYILFAYEPNKEGSEAFCFGKEIF